MNAFRLASHNVRLVNRLREAGAKVATFAHSDGLCAVVQSGPLTGFGYSKADYELIVGFRRNPSLPAKPLAERLRALRIARVVAALESADIGDGYLERFYMAQAAVLSLCEKYRMHSSEAAACAIETYHDQTEAA